MSSKMTGHGETAARRQAITELLFFSSVGDLHRCKKITQAWGLQLQDPSTADYDKRTPLHLAAAEGCYSVAEWLMQQGVAINPVDRFKRTPLEDAVRGDHGEVATLLILHGAKVINKDGDLCELQDSPLAGNVRIFTDYDPEWEIDPNDLTLHEMIGEGEFGIVHKASWHGTTVAVKILKETGAVAIGDFRTELNVLQKVHHPYTVQFLGAVTKYQPFMIVTEYMTGGSVSDMFRSGPPPNMWRAVHLALDCAKGLAYLHNRSPHAVIHRDLKPANLMLGGPKTFNSKHKQLLTEELGVLKIADFGLSKSLKLTKSKGRQSVDNSHNNGDPSNSARNSGSMPTNGSVKGEFPKQSNAYKLTGETGSYRYMAPEVFRHEQYNNKVDVYSFAMIFYQLLQGVPPFHRMEPVAAARQAAKENKRPEWMPTSRNGEAIPEKAKKIVEKCWNADYEARPELEDIIAELEDLAVDLKMPPSRLEQVPKTDKRSRSNCCSVM